MGLKIIDEDVFEGYYSIKAHRGGKLAIATGDVRDVDLLITGTEKNYELRLRTGAWGRDIAIPAILGGAIVRAGAVTLPTTAVRAGAAIAGAAARVAGIAVTGAAVGATIAGAPLAAGAAVALIEAYRAGKFEKDFWTWLKSEIVSLGKEATMSKPRVIVPQASK